MESALRRQQYAQRKRERSLRTSIRMARQPGRGKFILLIRPRTFQVIIQHVHIAQGAPSYTVKDIARGLKQIYYHNKLVKEIPSLDRRTLLYHLRTAINAADIAIPEDRSVGLTTLRFSGRVVRYIERHQRMTLQQFAQRSRLIII